MNRDNECPEGENMEQACAKIDNDQSASLVRPVRCSLAVSCHDFRIIENKGITYYVVDLRKTETHSIETIIDECAAVEKECWNAQEDFYDYIRKCDLLSFAVMDNRIIGFDVASVFHYGTICLYSNDETMVLKAFCNRNVAGNLVFATMRWFLINADVNDVKHFVFMSISGNPRIINGYYKHRYIQKLFDSSFNASDKLIALMGAYRQRYNIDLVHGNYPFCLKKIFPGSNTFNPAEKRYQFLDDVKKHMPEDFDHMKRGDAFAFLVKISRISARILVFCLMIKGFGKRFFSHRGVGLFHPKKVQTRTRREL